MISLVTDTDSLVATVEPLLKDTLNKGHNYILPLCKGQILWSLQYHGNTILPLKEDNLSITVNYAKNCWSQGVRYLEVPL